MKMRCSDHVSIIIFTMLIGSVVSLIAASGGLHGIVFKLARYAGSSVLSQIYAWLMGLLSLVLLTVIVSIWGKGVPNMREMNGQ